MRDDRIEALKRHGLVGDWCDIKADLIAKRVLAPDTPDDFAWFSVVAAMCTLFGKRKIKDRKLELAIGELIDLTNSPSTTRQEKQS